VLVDALTPREGLSTPLLLQLFVQSFMNIPFSRAVLGFFWGVLAHLAGRFGPFWGPFGGLWVRGGSRSEEAHTRGTRETNA